MCGDMQRPAPHLTEYAASLDLFRPLRYSLGVKSERPRLAVFFIAVYPTPETRLELALH